jgi:hypothetical protein
MVETENPQHQDRPISWRWLRAALFLIGFAGLFYGLAFDWSLAVREGRLAELQPPVGLVLFGIMVPTALAPWSKLWQGALWAVGVLSLSAVVLAIKSA